MYNNIYHGGQPFKESVEIFPEREKERERIIRKQIYWNYIGLQREKERERETNWNGFINHLESIEHPYHLHH